MRATAAKTVVAAGVARVVAIAEAGVTTHALVARVLVVRVKTLHMVAITRVGLVAAIERIVSIHLHRVVSWEHRTLSMRHLAIPGWALIRRVLLVGTLIFILLIKRVISPLIIILLVWVSSGVLSLRETLVLRVLLHPVVRHLLVARATPLAASRCLKGALVKI
jgi:hypothetical protein